MASKTQCPSVTPTQASNLYLQSKVLPLRLLLTLDTLAVLLVVPPLSLDGFQVACRFASEHLLVHGDAGQLGKTCRPDVWVGSSHPANLDKACMFGPKGVLSKKTIHYS